MLQHVYERASQARYLSHLVIATDDDRIVDEARQFGGPVRRTRADHLSGTDRVAEVASAENADLIVNIQGDEPLIDPSAIDIAVMSVYDEHQDELEKHAFMMGKPRGHLAVTLDILTDALVLVGQHGVYCQSVRQAGKPAMDVQLISKGIVDAKELIAGVMAELKSAKAPVENN